jgi:hypothetical protein
MKSIGIIAVLSCSTLLAGNLAYADDLQGSQGDQQLQGSQGAQQSQAGQQPSQAGQQQSQAGQQQSQAGPPAQQPQAGQQQSQAGPPAQQPQAAQQSQSEQASPGTLASQGSPPPALDANHEDHVTLYG